MLIVGSGGAGCAAAIEASAFTKKILIVTKNLADNSKTQRAQGGIQAAISEEDSPELHFADTLKAGNYKNDKAIVKKLTSSAPETIEWLEKIGVRFDRLPSGAFKLKGAAGLSKPRVLSCGDSTGNRIVGPLLTHVKKMGLELREFALVKNIQKVENHFEILISFKGVEEKVLSKTVIIATGGLLPKEKRAGLKLKDHEYAPDGVELAKQLGATVKNVDLLQYHPTGIILPKPLRRMRLPEPMRACGAKFLDKDLNPFVDSLITRNKLTNEIVALCEKGKGVETKDGYRGVWLSTPEIDRINGEGYTKENFPKFYNAFMEHDHDLTKHNVLVYPIVHYSLGGICIDEKTATSVEGLFAAGETTYGVHGEDRLMGNSLLDIFVFGRVAGNSAINYIKSNVR